MAQIMRSVRVGNSTMLDKPKSGNGEQCAQTRAIGLQALARGKAPVIAEEAPPPRRLRPAFRLRDEQGLNGRGRLANRAQGHSVGFVVRGDCRPRRIVRHERGEAATMQRPAQQSLGEAATQQNAVEAERGAGGAIVMAAGKAAKRLRIGIGMAIRMSNCRAPPATGWRRKSRNYAWPGRRALPRPYPSRQRLHADPASTKKTFAPKGILVIPPPPALSGLD